MATHTATTTALAAHMAGKRVPLAAVPNAVNSPVRAGIIGKRSRAGDQNDVFTQPPAKRQMVEADEENVDPRNTLALTQVDELFPKRALHAKPTPLERKLVASREARHPAKPVALDKYAEHKLKVAADNLESVRQWQRHYRRQFPAFVFYLDSVADDVRARCSKMIRQLGAREEKFFSKAVTHVVTTRNVLPESEQQARSGAASMLDQTLQKRHAGYVHPSELDSRRPQPQVADVLIRARELGIKIWALEKLQRVLKTMFDADTGEQGPTLDVLRTATAVDAVKQSVRTSKDADLEQLLRNEKLTGPADRDMTAAAQDMVGFKGCFIYIHDMDERMRPTMVRDYTKPNNKTEGKWPQFHMTSQGRCPFVEDTNYHKQVQQQEQQAKAQRDIASQRRTRASAAEVKPLTEINSNLRRSPRKATAPQELKAAPLGPPKIPHERRTSQEDVPLFANIANSSRAMPRMIGGMPVASGMQHSNSNVTSAIRSQAVSSTAISSTAPNGMSGRNLTQSKELNALKRKVLERGPSALSQPPSSYVGNEMRAAINDESAAPAIRQTGTTDVRVAKRRAQESTLGVVQEHETVAEASAVQTQAKKTTTTTAAKKRKASTEKDAKAGYCENCRDKFDDFEEHIASRKHLKFARAAENFKDLDALIAQLRRPRKAC